MVGKAGTDTGKNPSDLVLAHQLSQHRVEPVQALDDDDIISLHQDFLTAVRRSAALMKVKVRNHGSAFIDQLSDTAVNQLNIQSVDAFEVRLSPVIERCLFGIQVKIVQRDDR